jgi:hypothetical protein
MEVKTCTFVDASDVFEGCPDAWQVFLDQVGDSVHWGNANRTMTTSELVEDVLQSWDSFDEEVECQIGKVLANLQNVNCYIDLEN